MKIYKFILIIPILFLSFIGPYFGFINSINSSSDSSIILEKGVSMNLGYEKIAYKSFINKIFFRLHLSIMDINSFEEGEYDSRNKSIGEMINLFVSGNTISHKLNIKEGSNIFDLQKTLETSSFKIDCKFLDCIETNYPFKEGILIADTFFYKRGMTSSSILQSSHRLLDKFLSDIWALKPENNPLNNKYDALILASIIEKEAGNNPEKKIIASVFLKRMNLGMRLQADPTIIYGLMPNFDGDIKKSDILNKDNLYNTYMIKGLPPTPISFSSLSSIEAAILSTPGEYLFFVADSPTSHYFSKTYDEHRMMIKTLGLN
jgi:UPF0755 protein|tara:strand:- start:137 stop:1090 length:954 start_codon:yes stop_codon:yes gene_type:complete